MSGILRIFFNIILPNTTPILATVATIFVCPFFQRYFVKGIMLGAVKG